jgi:hypothetical protein
MKLIIFYLFVATILCRVPVTTWDHCEVKHKSIIKNKVNKEIEILKFEANSGSLHRGETFIAYITSKLVSGNIDVYKFPSIRVKISKDGSVMQEKTYRLCDITKCPINEGDVRMMELTHEVPRIPTSWIDDRPWNVVAEFTEGSSVIECIKFEVQIKE